MAPTNVYLKESGCLWKQGVRPSQLNYVYIMVCKPIPDEETLTLNRNMSQFQPPKQKLSTFPCHEIVVGPTEVRIKMFLKLFPTQRVPVIRYSGAISTVSEKGFEMSMCYLGHQNHKRCQKSVKIIQVITFFLSVEN